jgi:hypothetical protein
MISVEGFAREHPSLFEWSEVLGLAFCPARHFGDLLGEPRLRVLRGAEQGWALTRAGAKAGLQKPLAALAIVSLRGKPDQHGQQIGTPEHKETLPVGSSLSKLDRLIGEDGRHGYAPALMW